MQPIVFFVFWWTLVESLSRLDEGCDTERTAEAAQNMMQAISLPRLTEVQWQAQESADIVETLREAVRLTGFKQSAIAEGTASRKQQTERTTMRIAYLLVGDAFRSSRRQLEPGSCASGSEEPQLNASKSQMTNIIKPLEQAGYDVSVYGVTYPCSGGQQLVQSLPGMFDGYMKGFLLAARTNITYGGQVGGWRAAVSQVMTEVNNNTAWFDYYILTRWDLVAEKATTPEFW